MPKEPFKVGDRVRVYGGIGGIATYQQIKTGTVEEVEADALGIRFDKKIDGAHFWWVHPKQCRRLVKKKRRRIWVSESSLAPNDSHMAYSVYGPRWEDSIEFVEVRKK